jgi:hypothetical protein
MNKLAGNNLPDQPDGRKNAGARINGVVSQSSSF